MITTYSTYTRTRQCCFLALSVRSECPAGPGWRYLRRFLFCVLHLLCIRFFLALMNYRSDVHALRSSVLTGCVASWWSPAKVVRHAYPTNSALLFTFNDGYRCWHVGARRVYRLVSVDAMRLRSIWMTIPRRTYDVMLEIPKWLGRIDLHSLALWCSGMRATVARVPCERLQRGQRTPPVLRQH